MAAPQNASYAVRRASYIPTTPIVLLKLHNMKHLHYRSAMKHFAYAPYDLSSIALSATDDEKMEKWEFIRLQYNAIRTTLWPAIQSFMAGFFYVLILPKVSPAFTANHRSGREQTENANFSEKACVLHRFSRNSLFGKFGGRLWKNYLQAIQLQEKICRNFKIFVRYYRKSPLL